MTQVATFLVFAENHHAALLRLLIEAPQSFQEETLKALGTSRREIIKETSVNIIKNGFRTTPRPILNECDTSLVK